MTAPQTCVLIFVHEKYTAALNSIRNLARNKLYSLSTVGDFFWLRSDVDGVSCCTNISPNLVVWVASTIRWNTHRFSLGCVYGSRIWTFAVGLWDFLFDRIFSTCKFAYAPLRPGVEVVFTKIKYSNESKFISTSCFYVFG